ncbi:hypothetical protein LTR84_004785 [Exophiala bonariae]|uniref:Uncharacterized protein n=1 Tax=Exophiala bonariae TaxID=1690606 RepID=A0AAV9NMV9_9EURO|nr:hypothetical protein LTR84_004785 [Exophiala bonariae]
MGRHQGARQHQTDTEAHQREEVVLVEADEEHKTIHMRQDPTTPVHHHHRGEDGDPAHIHGRHPEDLPDDGSQEPEALQEVHRDEDKEAQATVLGAVTAAAGAAPEVNLEVEVDTEVDDEKRA